MIQTFLSQSEFKQRSQATLHWLLRSIEATDFQGSAAFYSRWRLPFRGWEKGYPETTGYIIETLLDYAQLCLLNPDSNSSELGANLARYGLHCANWLIPIQSPMGHYPALLGDKNQPSVFNSSQILFGLIRAFQYSKNEKYLRAAENTVDWLIDNLEENGSWKVGAYQKDYIPTYYTRAVWGVLFANQVLHKMGINEKMKIALDYYYEKINPNGTIQNWSFAPNQNALTHTIAYTLRGFLECSLILNDEKYLNGILKTCDYFLNQNEIAGSYNEKWAGDFSFKCVTGHCQLSIIFCKLFQINRKKIYFEKAVTIFNEIKNAHNTSYSINRKGAISGSIPFYGKYMRLKYPNWAAKFYLDALLSLFQTKKEYLEIF